MWKERLKKEWNENPLQVIAVAALAANAAAKLIDAVSSSRSKNAYARQINRR